MVLVAGFSSGFPMLRTTSICQGTNPCEQKWQIWPSTSMGTMVVCWSCKQSWSWKQCQIISKVLGSHTVPEQQSDLVKTRKRPRNKFLRVLPDKMHHTEAFFDFFLKMFRFPENLQISWTILVKKLGLGGSPDFQFVTYLNLASSGGN